MNVSVWRKPMVIMKSIPWRSPMVIGAIGVTVIAAIAAFALSYHNIPFLNGSKRYSAYFSEASGLMSGADVQVAGLKAGKVSSITIDGSKVLVAFDVDGGEDQSAVGHQGSRDHRAR
jgi:phospholipid/cholesterol/gamma-HCH transport system substrate-binding protein